MSHEGSRSTSVEEVSNISTLVSNDCNSGVLKDKCCDPVSEFEELRTNEVVSYECEPYTGYDQDCDTSRVVDSNGLNEFILPYPIDSSILSHEVLLPKEANEL